MNEEKLNYEFLKKIHYFRTINDLLAATQGQIPVRLIDFGHIIRPYDGSGFIGGEISHISVDHLGRLIFGTAAISSILGCGHLVSSIHEIGGYCQICGALSCRRYGCLMICDFKGITVCRRHYTLKDGIVVSSIAQRGLWKRKAKKIAEKRKELFHVRELPDRS